MKILRLKYFIIGILIFCACPLIIFGGVKDARTRSEATGVCGKFNGKMKGCIDTEGCEWIGVEDSDTGAGVCRAPYCSEKPNDCDSYNYCTSHSFTSKEINKCTDKVSYKQNPCLAIDDYGEKNPDYDASKCGAENYNPISLSYGGEDTSRVCQQLYELPDTTIFEGEALTKYCEEKFKDFNSRDNCKKAGKRTIQSVRSDMCGSHTCSGKNQIPYKTVHGGTGQTVEGCTCRAGYVADPQNVNNCIKTGGGGGGSNCVTVESFVESYKVKNVCTGSNSCSLADCSENENGAGDADPFDKSRGHLFDTGVNNIIINGKGTGAYGGNGKAWRYNGTCNGKATDVFCIDPGARYHDNNAGYKCSSSMNEESDIDSGYVRIYQSALAKYLEMYKDGTHELNDDQYQGIHFAFRFWTFYKEMGRFEGKDAEDFSDHPLMEYSNSEISKGFNGTAKWIVGKRSEQTYFMVKPSVHGYDVPNTSTDPGYRDSVEFFKDAVDNHTQIWKNPLDFQLVGQINFNTGTAKVRLLNIQQLRDERFLNADGSNKYNFVKGIGCREAGCTISGIDPNRDYLAAGDDSITFDVKFSGSSFTVYAKYYDKRDGKNVILATAGTPGDYQRLLFVTSALSGSISRIFEIEENFNTSSKPPCRIENNTFYGNDGDSLGKDYQKYTTECCDSHLIEDEALHDKYCNMLRSIVGVNHTDYKAACVSPYRETWSKKGCPTTCTPNNTTPKSGECDELEGEAIIISDLTDDRTLQTGNFHDSDHYCLSCVGQNNSTDVTGNSYLRINNNY